MTALLSGRRVAVTRPRERMAGLVAALEALGAEVLAAPAVEIAPPESWAALDDALARVATFDWVALTSVAAVEAVADRLGRTLPYGVRVAAVGAATARAARERLGRVDLVPATQTADELAEAVPGARGARVLFPAADRARDALPAVLKARGALVERVVAYRTLPASPDALTAAAPADAAGTLDAVVLASPSAAQAVARACGAPLREPRGPRIVCIGPATAQACAQLGLAVSAVAASPSDDALVGALCGCFSD
ncbi:uroporphyrinogen-III synthase [Roseisolibacter sp. H3M3-2]|uniref:uroporphyrinogen-III synthase n=1 Tax=Roseisolibacter sp. H3M3-2 TaxID=3031323 RepID=UPI0023DAC758|nr:uroporphyrinogen-III synthase [Roseisolibacter sp. H3M3-2]MDF1502402.1 uroporphyrinogen-III synthase [Roseisolibacter sp. H3M3-2]